MPTAEASTEAPARTWWRRRRLVAGVAALVVAGGVVLAVTGLTGGGDPPDQKAGAGTTLVAVQEGPLSSQVSETGTLAYSAGADGNPYAVINRASGTYTWVPVLLICGSTPAYRDLAVSDHGKDVRALNKTLVDEGYAHRSELDPDSSYFGWGTAVALEKLQDDRGANTTGRLDLGQAVFLPGPLRIGRVTAGNGTGASPGRTVMEASSNRHQVVVKLDASQQSEVKKGAAAQVTLPDNRITPGVVSRVGTVVTTSGSSKDDAGSATIPVYVALQRPKDAGTLEQAPVQVQITTGGVDHALIVPVTALIGQAGGGYAVEVTVGSAGRTRIVPVTLGLFDDANGRVQVSGALTAADRVVVPST
jgi:hypothetical protein